MVETVVLPAPIGPAKLSMTEGGAFPTFQPSWTCSLIVAFEFIAITEQ